MTAPAAQASTRCTTADLDILARQEGTREEIIAGERHMSSQPDWHHQETSDNLVYELKAWGRRGGVGRALSAPGVIFDEENAVAPDVV